MTDAPEPVNAVPVNPPPKPGWKTSEFWLNKFAILLSVLFATNAIPTGSFWMKIALIIATMLGSLGYTVSRTIIKTAGMLFLVAFGLHATSGCSWSKTEAKTIETAAVDCTKGELKNAVDMFVPVVGKLLQLATGADGKVDWTQVEDGTKKLAGDVGGCVLGTAVAQALKPTQVKPGAPQSSPLEVDAADLRAHFEATRLAKFGGKTYVTEAGPL